MNIFFFAWFVIAILFAVLEMVSLGLFYFLSFSIGAFVASFVSLATESLITQCIVFLVATVCSLVLLRFWIARKAEKHHMQQRTNMYALQGKRAYVIKSILPGMPGQVKIHGEVWLARSLNRHELEVGQIVEVVSVSGAHVVVDIIEK